MKLKIKILTTFALVAMTIGLFSLTQSTSVIAKRRREI